jgi:hypothetical protein
MALMALDHVRDFFSSTTVDPTDVGGMRIAPARNADSELRTATNRAFHHALSYD